MQQRSLFGVAFIFVMLLAIGASFPLNREAKTQVVVSPNAEAQFWGAIARNVLPLALNYLNGGDVNEEEEAKAQFIGKLGKLFGMWKKQQQHNAEAEGLKTDAFETLFPLALNYLKGGYGNEEAKAQFLAKASGLWKKQQQNAEAEGWKTDAAENLFPIALKYLKGGYGNQEAKAQFLAALPGLGKSLGWWQEAQVEGTPDQIYPDDFLRKLFDDNVSSVKQALQQKRTHQALISDLNQAREQALPPIFENSMKMMGQVEAEDPISTQ